jgi:hypothetical protein
LQPSAGCPVPVQQVAAFEAPQVWPCLLQMPTQTPRGPQPLPEQQSLSNWHAPPDATHAFVQVPVPSSGESGPQPRPAQQSALAVHASPDALQRATFVQVPPSQMLEQQSASRVQAAPIARQP